MKVTRKMRDPYLDIGVRGRLGYGIIAIFAQYAMEDSFYLIPNLPLNLMYISRFSLGIELSVNY
jgi:hypothetical protein